MAASRARVAAAVDGDKDALGRLLSRPVATATVWLATDGGDAQRALQDARDAERLAKLGGPAEQERAAAAIADARAELEASAVPVVLYNAGRKAYRKLLEAHPPTEADHKEAQRVSGDSTNRSLWAASFVPALVDLSIRSPEGLTSALLDEMADDGRISDGDLIALFNAAYRLYQTSRVADLGK